MPRINEHSDTLSRARDHRIHFLALGVSSAPLDIIFEQVLVDRIEDDLGYLGSGCIVEEYEVLPAIQSGKYAANGLDQGIGWRYCQFPPSESIRSFILRRSLQADIHEGPEAARIS